MLPSEKWLIVTSMKFAAQLIPLKMMVSKAISQGTVFGGKNMPPTAKAKDTTEAGSPSIVKQLYVAVSTQVTIQ